MKFIWKEENIEKDHRMGSSVCGLNYRGKRPDMVAFTDQDFFAMYKMEPEQLKNYLLHLAPCIRERSFVTNEIRPGMRQLIPKDNSHVRVEKQRFDGAKLIAPSLIGGEDR